MMFQEPNVFVRKAKIKQVIADFIWQVLNIKFY